MTLAFTLFSARVGATLYDADFYKRHLAEQDVYGFALGEFTTTAIDELRGKPPDFFSEILPENPIQAMGLSTTELVQSVNNVFPQEWAQAQVEGAIDGVIGYVSGDRDDLDVLIAFHERVPAASIELKPILSSDGVHGLVLELYAAREVDEALEHGAAPFGVDLKREDVVAAIDRSVPAEWLSPHVVAAIDEIAAYVSSQQDTLEIHVPLYERADAAIEELNALYAETDLDDAQLAELVGSEIAARLPAVVEMPFGVALAGAEVAEAAAAGLPSPWLERQARLVIASAAPYVVGSLDGFSAGIPTVEVRAAALESVESLVWVRLESRLAALPDCEVGETPFRTGAPAPNEMPKCLPPGASTAALLDSLDMDVAGDVERVVGVHFPSAVEYTRADLRRGMGGADSPSVLAMDRLRALFSDGWTYTESDLLEDWSGEEGDGVDNLRSILTDGWRITLDDLDGLTGAEDGEAGASVALRQIRALPVGSAALTLVMALALAAMLAAAGLLGGQGRRGRLAWASAMLASASFVLLLASVVTVGPVLQSAIGEVGADAAASAGSVTAELAADKSVDVAQSMARDFTRGLTLNCLWLFLAGALAFGLSFWRAGAMRRS